ncbi:FAD synthetase family protein [Thermoactinomyces sp. FSL K6-2592]|uniref:FAD synthetase family protein n=1 Tax=Thermoactinomyces sp. FSL K6-2592 TaxID=2975347 RepID=UPI0030F84FE2
MRIHMVDTLALPASVVAIGAFDGVHRGHQKVIGEVVKKSKSLGVPSVVYTFDPPPRSYFEGASILTPIHEKLRRLCELQVDHVVVANFDAAYLERSAKDFIRELSNLHPVEVMVGKDFRFGRGREGGLEDLAEHFPVWVIDAVCCSCGEVISSTRIRQLIAQGEMVEALSLLN